jgi:hypothetical protein
MQNNGRELLIGHCQPPIGSSSTICVGCPIDGCTEAIMVAHGFTVDMLADIIRAGLATVKIERMVAGGRPMEVRHRVLRRRTLVD